MSAEAKNSPTDMFDAFWNAISLDSKKCDISLIEKHVFNEENRDINFDKPENRLAFLYRFGNFNIHLSEKCFTNFFENCSVASHLFSKNSLQICSLTNGPGLDLIGLFKSIYNQYIRLKSVPHLKIIALYDTWWNISHRLFTDFYEVIRPCYEENVKGSLIKVDGIVNDIYTELSPEARTCIGESDILLMFKVFYSSRATSKKALDCMKEIFSLLKPGSFVFFLGSKTNTTELAEKLMGVADCILGPIQISSDLKDDDAMKPAALQPRKSGSGYFVVWKKKDTVLQKPSIPKKKRTRRKNKLKNNGILTENDETNSSIDTQSELSFNSCGEQSGTLTDGCKSASCENLYITGVKTKLKRKGLRKEVLKHLFCDSLYNLSDNSDLDSKTSTSHKDIALSNKCFDELQTVPHANLVRSHSVIEISKRNLVKNHLNSSLSDLPHSVNSLTTLFDKMKIQPVKARSRSACNLNEIHQAKKEGNIREASERKYSNPAKFQDDLLKNIETSRKQKVEKISSEISQDKSKLTKKSKKNKEQSMISENSSVLSESVSENKMDKNMHNARTALENKMQSNLAHSKECSSVEEKTLSKNHESNQDFNTLLQLKLKVQNISSEVPQDNSKISTKSSRKNKSRSVINENSSMLSGFVTDNKIDENTLNSRIAVENKMQKNLIQSKSCMGMEEKASNVSGGSKQDFNSLLQRCESLVTSLEKLTCSIQSNITSRNNHHSRCCYSESSAESKPLPVCATSCTQNSNCRKNFNCRLCLKCNYSSCTRINSCGASRAKTCECSDVIIPKRVSNISTPYVVMPVTKEDILHILTSKKS